MRQPTNNHTPSTTVQPTQSFMPGVILVAATLATLFAIFGIPALAENVAWHHAAQHVIIFVSGAGAGASLLSIRNDRKDG